MEKLGIRELAGVVRFAIQQASLLSNECAIYERSRGVDRQRTSRNASGVV
jgi:hypothetical protein